MAKKKSKYTSAQRNAYHSGRGYAMAYNDKGIEFKSTSVKESFQAGFKSQNDKIKKNPGKYPANKRAK